MKRNAAVLVAAAAVPLLLVPLVARADEPPPGVAEATAARVGGVADVSHAKADAGGEGTGASAEVLRIGGTTPLPQLGGRQTGRGRTHGGLAEVGDDATAHVRVAPWDATVDDAEQRSSSRAAVARAGIAKLFSLDVLQSEASAARDANGTSGSSSGDAAALTVGDGLLRLFVLHGETSSATGGRMQLLQVNDQSILGSSDGQALPCDITASAPVQLVCLAAGGGAAGGSTDGATGGSAATPASATGAQAIAGDAVDVGLFEFASNGAPATPAGGADGTPAGAPGAAPGNGAGSESGSPGSGTGDGGGSQAGSPGSGSPSGGTAGSGVGANDAAASEGGTGSAGGGLAGTGAAVALQVLAGALLVLVGAGLARWQRRSRA